MTKFLDALKVQIDPDRRVKALAPSFMGEPMTLTADLVRIDRADRYIVSLHWQVPIYMCPPVTDQHINEARREAMSVLKGMLYGEIHSKLAEIKFFVEYNESEKAVGKLQKLMVEIMS
jgi:hypothetical protein